jgi:hypothetical protein
LEVIPPENNFLTTVLKKAAERWLAQQKKDEIGLQGSGDIIELGNIYILEVKKADPTPWFPSLQNLTQEWKVLIRARYPDGTELPISGTVIVEPVSAWTQPAPPDGPRYPSLMVPKEGATVRLGKGWRYRFLPTTGGQERVHKVPGEGNPPTVILYVNLSPPPPEPPAGE